MDGFPRTVGQALSLDKLLAASGQRVSLAINLAVSEKSVGRCSLDGMSALINIPAFKILNRVSGRWIHPPSGRIYNLAYNPPRVPFHDDDTGEPLVQRDDDRPVGSSGISGEMLTFTSFLIRTSFAEGCAISKSLPRHCVNTTRIRANSLPSLVRQVTRFMRSCKR